MGAVSEKREALDPVSHLELHHDCLVVGELAGARSCPGRASRLPGVT